MTGLLFLFGASVLVGLVDVARRNHNLNAAADDVDLIEVTYWVRSLKQAA